MCDHNNAVVHTPLTHTKKKMTAGSVTAKSDSTDGHLGDVMLDDLSISGVFDFRRSCYTHPRRIWGLSELVFRLLAIILGLVGIIGGVLILKYTNGYSLCTDNFPEKVNYGRELVRWLMFVSVGLAADGFFHSVVYLLPVLVSKYYAAKQREVPDRVSSGLIFFINVSHQVTSLLTSLALYFTALSLFPPPNGEVPVLTNGAGDEAGKLKDSTIRNLFKALKEKSAKDTYAQHPWQIFACRLLLAIAVGSFLFLLKRILIVKIAIHFHSRTLKSEMEDNKKGLEVVKALKRKVLGTNLHVKHEELGPALFDRLCKRGASEIKVEDLAPYMTEAECNFFFTLIDINENGDLTREEFTVSISNMYRQRQYLQKSVFDENKILRGLDSILRNVIIVACIVLSFALLEPQMSTQITTFGTTFISATILFHGTAAIAFQSIVFIVVTHPFDVGDKVIIDDETLIVQEIGLWSCEFTSTDDGKTVYLTNHNMRKMYIANLKRSPPMDEDFTIKVYPDTTQEKLDELESKLKAYVEERKREYSSTVIKSMKLLDRDRMELVIGLNHKSNFQNLDLKYKRSKEFMLHLRECLDAVSIKLSPAF